MRNWYQGWLLETQDGIVLDIALIVFLVLNSVMNSLPMERKMPEFPRMQ